MPKITIDGRELPFEGKKMILQVAIDNGLALPFYCYHPGLSIVASCRICLAEVAQPNPKSGQLEMIPKLVPTCQTPAVEGMVVHSQSPKSIANQKAVMEYLLINHPLDCPVCDKAGECSLQDYSYQYGRGVSRLREDKVKQPVKDIGPRIKLYADRCIMCSRCVRFTREVTGTSELAIFGRGSTEQIDIFPGKPLDNELSGNVVDICPVGALTDKDFLFAQRVWFLARTPSIDGITASGDNISIQHNEGRIYRIMPRTNLQVNKWWISDEIRHGWKFIHADNRLVQPRRTQLNTQTDCGWPRALEDAGDGLRKLTAQGAGSLALLLSPMLSCEEAYLWGQLARKLDSQAVLGIGPIPMQGQNKTFPGGYTIYAEKCPNSRGVRRALELVAGDEVQVLAYEDWCKKLADKATTVGGAIITGNYPTPWTSKELSAALSKKFLVWIDTLPNDLTGKADVLLPGATWAEKAGTFENAQGLLQSFKQAISVMEGTRPEGQIVLDLAAAMGIGPAAIFDAAEVRTQMGGIFVTQVQHPSPEKPSEPDMVYMPL